MYERRGQNLGRDRITARRAAASAQGRSVSRGHRRVVTSHARSDRAVATRSGGGAELIAGVPRDRVLRLLRCDGGRGRERAQLHAGGTDGGCGRRGCVRGPRAPALAQWRRRWPAGPPGYSGGCVGGVIRTFTVVGVVREPGSASGSSLDTFRRVYLPTAVESPDTWLLRVRGNPEQARQALVERLSVIDPTLMNVMPLQALARMQTYPLQVAFGSRSSWEDSRSR